MKAELEQISELVTVEDQQAQKRLISLFVFKRGPSDIRRQVGHYAQLRWYHGKLRPKTRAELFLLRKEHT